MGDLPKKNVLIIQIPFRVQSHLVPEAFKYQFEAIGANALNFKFSIPKELKIDCFFISVFPKKSSRGKYEIEDLSTLIIRIKQQYGALPVPPYVICFENSQNTEEVKKAQKALETQIEKADANIIYREIKSYNQKTEGFDFDSDDDSDYFDLNSYDSDDDKTTDEEVDNNDLLNTLKILLELGQEFLFESETGILRESLQALSCAIIDYVQVYRLSPMDKDLGFYEEKIKALIFDLTQYSDFRNKVLITLMRELKSKNEPAFMQIIQIMKNPTITKEDVLKREDITSHLINEFANLKLNLNNYKLEDFKTGTFDFDVNVNLKEKYIKPLHTISSCLTRSRASTNIDFNLVSEAADMMRELKSEIKEDQKKHKLLVTALGEYLKVLRGLGTEKLYGAQHGKIAVRGNQMVEFKKYHETHYLDNIRDRLSSENVDINSVINELKKRTEILKNGNANDISQILYLTKIIAKHQNDNNRQEVSNSVNSPLDYLIIVRDRFRHLKGTAMIISDKPLEEHCEKFIGILNNYINSFSELQNQDPESNPYQAVLQQLLNDGDMESAYRELVESRADLNSAKTTTNDITSDSLKKALAGKMLNLGSELKNMLSKYEEDIIFKKSTHPKK